MSALFCSPETFRNNFSGFVLVRDGWDPATGLG